MKVVPKVLERTVPQDIMAVVSCQAPRHQHLFHQPDPGSPGGLYLLSSVRWWSAGRSRQLSASLSHNLLLVAEGDVEPIKGDGIIVEFRRIYNAHRTWCQRTKVQRGDVDTLNICIFINLRAKYVHTQNTQRHRRTLKGLRLNTPPTTSRGS